MPGRGGVATAAPDVRRAVLELVRCDGVAPEAGLLLKRMSSCVWRAVREGTAGPDGRRSGRFGGILSMDALCAANRSKKPVLRFFFVFFFDFMRRGKKMV